MFLFVCALTPAPAGAAEPAPPPAPATTPAGSAGSEATAPSPAPENGTGATPEQAEAPRLQIQDEGPSAHSDRLHLRRTQLQVNDESAEERPFWKSWIFWTVTGALVLSAAGMLAYTSGKDDVAPCPVDIAVSLRCWGAGR